MNTTNLTLLVVAIIGVISSYVTPKLLNRREVKKAAEAATDVSWVAINKAIVTERDRLQDDLDEQTKKHAAELDAERVKHRQELADANERLRDSQTKVSTLYHDLYELQRQRPPDTQPS